MSLSDDILIITEQDKRDSYHVPLPDLEREEEEVQNHTQRSAQQYNKDINTSPPNKTTIQVINQVSTEE